MSPYEAAAVVARTVAAEGVAQYLEGDVRATRAVYYALRAERERLVNP